MESSQPPSPRPSAGRDLLSLRPSRVHPFEDLGSSPANPAFTEPSRVFVLPFRGSIGHSTSCQRMSSSRQERVLMPSPSLRCIAECPSLSTKSIRSFQPSTGHSFHPFFRYSYPSIHPSSLHPSPSADSHGALRLSHGGSREKHSKSSH